MFSINHLIRMLRNRKGLLWLSILLISTGISFKLMAATLSSMAVTSNDGEYSIRLEMTLNVPAKYVREVLTDYRHIYRLNPSIIESRIMDKPGHNITRVYTKITDCVLFFCTEISRVEDVHESESGHIIAKIVAEQSDFNSGLTSWEITENNGQSRIIYDALMRPGFFIPPVVGDYFVKSKLKQSLVMSFKRIECNAKIRSFIAEKGEGAVNVIRDKALQC